MHLTIIIYLIFTTWFLSKIDYSFSIKPCNCPKDYKIKSVPGSGPFCENSRGQTIGCNYPLQPSCNVPSKQCINMWIKYSDGLKYYIKNEMYKVW